MAQHPDSLETQLEPAALLCSFGIFLSTTEAKFSLRLERQGIGVGKEMVGFFFGVGGTPLPRLLVLLWSVDHARVSPLASFL